MSNDFIFGSEYPIQPQHIDVVAVANEARPFQKFLINPIIIAGMVGVCQEYGHWKVMSHDEVEDYCREHFDLPHAEVRKYWNENSRSYFELDLFTSKAMLLHDTIAECFRQFPSLQVRAGRFVPENSSS